ncbi:hypothetical protein LINPERHAP2_LOCUS33142 [Linum perenne]
MELIRLSVLMLYSHQMRLAD